MNAFKQMLGELITSKKFMAAMVGVVVAVGGRYGLSLDPDLINQILAVIGVYIVGQSIADHKKEAEKIAAVSAASLSKPSKPKANKAMGKMADSVSAKE